MLLRNTFTQTFTSYLRSLLWPERLRPRQKVLLQRIYPTPGVSLWLSGKKGWSGQALSFIRPRPGCFFKQHNVCDFEKQPVVYWSVSAIKYKKKSQGFESCCNLRKFAYGKRHFEISQIFNLKHSAWGRFHPKINQKSILQIQFYSSSIQIWLSILFNFVF